MGNLGEGIEGSQGGAWVVYLTGIAAVLGVLFVLAGKLGSRKLRLPPSPPGLPLLGNLTVLSSPSLHVTFTNIAKKLGPIFMLRIGPTKAIVLSTSDLAKEVLKTQDQSFANRPHSTARHNLFYGEDSVVMGNYDATYIHLRKIMTSQLLNSQRVEEFSSVRLEELSSMFRSIWKGCKRQDPDGVDLHHMIFVFSSNNITRLLMGRRCYEYDGAHGGAFESEEALMFRKTVEAYIFLTGAPIIGDWIPQLGFLDRIKNIKAAMRKTRDTMSSYLDKLIQDRRLHNSRKKTHSSNTDFLDVLLSLPGPKGAKTLSDREIKALFVELLVAGSETVAVTVEWALSELIRNPEVMAKLQQEVDSVVDKSRVVEETDLRKMPFLLKVVKESYRLHASGAILVPHRSSKACKVGGYDIPKDTITFVNAYAIHRDETNWPNPQKFDPDRFSVRDVSHTGQDFELLPFGAGRRSCPGMPLGDVVVLLTVARLVHMFHWSLPHGLKPQDLDMSEKGILSIARLHRLMAVPSPRLSDSLY